MPGPSPLNSACNCCVQNTPDPALQFVAAAQSCTTQSCGEAPCTSTEAVYDGNGKCISAETVCSPNWAELSRAEKCANKKYLTVTTVDTSGGSTHGRTQVRQYTTDETGKCEVKTTCSGSTTTVTKSSYVPPPPEPPTGGPSECTGDYSASGNQTVTDTYTYNKDCTSTVKQTCSGTSQAGGSFICKTSDGQVLAQGSNQCNSELGEDCKWSGTYSSTCCSPGSPTDTGPTYAPCVDINNVDSVETTPASNCTVTVTYSGENAQGFCTPEQFPAFPAFWDQHGRWIGQCTQDESIELVFPEYEPGQSGFTAGGATPVSSVAYKYVNPHNPQIKSEQKARYRPEHRPTSTCYLKMWFRKVVQKWKYEDCDTGFPGDPTWDGGTPPADVNCNENGGSPCYSRWSTDGEPTFQDDGNYEWKGTGYPCYADEDKTPHDCANYITNTPVKDLNAAENTSVTVEMKWSFIKDYEPNWYDKNGSQGCKPNGYPIPNPAECPEYIP